MSLLGAASSHNDGQPEVVMALELCAGGSAAADIARRKEVGQPYRTDELWSLFADVVAAVRVLHNRDVPVAHRDLKPENVLLSDGSGRKLWKLCDFGSATTRVYNCAVDADRRAAEDDIERNTTMAYRAPEQVDLLRRQIIDEEVDIWALGCILFKVRIACTLITSYIRQQSYVEMTNCAASRKVAYLEGPFENGEGLGILNVAYYIPQGAEARYDANVQQTIAWIFEGDPAKRPTIDEVAARVAGIRGVTLDPPAATTRRRRAQPSTASTSASATPKPQAPKNPPATVARLFDMLGDDAVVAPPATTAGAAPATAATTTSTATRTASAGAATAKSTTSSNAAGLFDLLGDMPSSSSSMSKSASTPQFSFDAFQSTAAPPSTSNNANNSGFGTSNAFGGSSGGNDLFGSFQSAPVASNGNNAFQFNSNNNTNTNAFFNSSSSLNSFGSTSFAGGHSTPLVPTPTAPLPRTSD